MRTRINAYILDGNYKEIIDAINSGFVYVGKMQDNVILINNKGQNSQYKVILYNTLIYADLRVEMDIDKLKRFSKDLPEIMEEHYKIEYNEDDVIEQFENISDALIALQRGSYKDYTARRL